jgi:O-Antigen ligase
MPRPGNAGAKDAAEPPQWVVLLVVAAVALLPLLQPAGPANTSPVDLPILAAIAATLIWAGAASCPLCLPYAVPVGVLVLAGTVAALHGPYRTAGLVALCQDLFLLAWCAAIANVCRTATTLSAILRAWIASALVWASYMFGALVSGHPGWAGVAPGNGLRAAITFGDPNLAASYFVLSILLVSATDFPRRRSARAIAYLVLFVAVVQTGSNGGFVSLMAAVLVSGGIRLFRRRGAAAVAVAICGVLVVIGAMAIVHPSRVAVRARTSSAVWIRDSVGRYAESVGDRQQLLHETLDLIPSSGVIGLGPASTKAALAAVQAPFVKEAHDDYLATLVERGVIGVAGLALLIGSVATRSRGVLGGLKEDVAAAVPRPEALVGALAGLAVAASFYGVLHFRHLWALLGLLAALYRWGRK